MMKVAEAWGDRVRCETAITITVRQRRRTSRLGQQKADPSPRSSLPRHRPMDRQQGVAWRFGGSDRIIVAEQILKHLQWAVLVECIWGILWDNHWRLRIQVSRNSIRFFVNLMKAPNQKYDWKPNNYFVGMVRRMLINKSLKIIVELQWWALMKKRGILVLVGTLYFWLVREIPK